MIKKEIRDLTFEQLVDRYRQEQHLAHDIIYGSKAIERQLLPETDYKLEAMKIASTLKNNNLDELLGRYDEIYKILTEKPKVEIIKKHPDLGPGKTKAPWMT